MKRFYCTVCQRVKRVRSLPVDVVNENATTITNRRGTCDRHSPRESEILNNYNKAVKVRKGA